MKLRVPKKIGKRTYEFEVEGNNLFDVVTESQKLSFSDVDHCGLCGGDNLILRTHVAQQKFKYTTVNCLGCKASLNFGQQTEKPDIFYLGRVNGDLKWKEYKQGDKND